MPIADPDADEEDNEEAAAATLDDLLTKARRRYHTKRTQARLPFVLGEGVEIALQLFIMLGKAVKGSPTWLEARTNDTLKCTTRWLCNEDRGLPPAAPDTVLDARGQVPCADEQG